MGRVGLVVIKPFCLLFYALKQGINGILTKRPFCRLATSWEESTMRGHEILNNPFKNKGTAFTQEERQN